jgi:8-oxo-dGTP pyrophosphatase MutT (NUDIX family)
VREDRVLRPDGNEGIYGVVEVRPSVGVVALTGDEQLVLVGQWRYTVQRYSWEIPRGGSHPGEYDMLEVARRELAEEAGWSAREWRSLGAVDVCNGVTTDVQHLFLATGLTRVESRQDPEEEIVVRLAPLGEAVVRAASGDITEVCSVAAILRAAAVRGLSHR